MVYVRYEQMLLTTPRHRATLWLLANAAWIAVAPAAALYFFRQQARGAYPVDADSIGLPIVGIGIWVVTLILPLNVLWFFLLKKYPGPVPLRTSAKRMTTRKQIIGVLGVIGAASCAVAATFAMAEDTWEMVPVLFAWCYVTLAMRAAHLAAGHQSVV
jgi:hypothetical protein